jgi:hypothetical protein
LLVLALAAGCTRSHYRKAADRDAYPILDERVVSPAYAIGRTRLEPAPESRLADPFDPDRPPKPPDDPAAALFMDRPGWPHDSKPGACDGPPYLRFPPSLRGSRKWGTDGHTDQIEPPGWLDALGLDERGVLKLDQDRAVEIALLNSRDYQSALEELYLQALTLTLNRFEFETRWFGRNATTFTHVGAGGFPAETNTLEVNSGLGFARSFAAGGQLLVDFANALVYEYSGGSSQVRSNLAVSFVQPLLRGAGRKVRLEALTQAERDTLYAVRQFARFRKSFWAGVAVGASSGGGGSFSPVGSFSATGAFGGVPGLTGGVSFGGFGGRNGYLDLLLLVQRLRNSVANLERQEETYRLYEELFRGGRASVVELDQFFQSWQDARLDVIEAETGLQDALDAFKLQLGLPPRLPVELDDSLLDLFVLTDPALDRLRDELEAFQRARLRELDQVPPVAALARNFDALRGLADRVPGVLDKAADDLARWGQQLDRPDRPGDDPEQRARARSAYEVLKKQLPDVVSDMKKAAAAIAAHKQELTEQTRKQSWEALNEDVKAVLSVADSVIAIQTQARIYLIELPEVDAKEAEAVAFARENRLDLQNQLGTVTDAWRKVTVAANALRSDVAVVLDANLGTDPDHKRPLNFAAEASRYAVGVRIDGPLNRMAERNQYRATLIGYQQAKRAYVELSDSIELQIRSDLRALNLLRVSFEISRQQLLAAARQYENARLTLLGPRDRRSANDTTTLNLQQALTRLQGARNSLASSFINYEQQRVQFLLDLEALQLDQKGFPCNGSARSGRPGSGNPPDALPPPVLDRGLADSKRQSLPPPALP